jgi:hypothetical protein
MVQFLLLLCGSHIVTKNKDMKINATMITARNNMTNLKLGSKHPFPHAYSKIALLFPVE